MLTRSQIAKASADAQVDFCLDKQPTYEVALARRIESAACAERDARIEELEQQLAEARKDAERWRWIWNHAHNVSFTYQVDPITSATVMRLHCGSLADVVDKAIRAAIKEQT